MSAGDLCKPRASTGRSRRVRGRENLETQGGSRAEGEPSDVTVFALAGAFLFAVSDTLIAVDRFHEHLPGGRYAIILLYWSGQFAITLSALRFARDERMPE